MTTFIYIVLAIMVACQIGIILWVVKKNDESDAKYEAELDRIYGRKR
jgi:hypothetical protein